MPKKAKTPLYMAATDGSTASGKALEYAIDRAKEAGARLLVVMAMQAGPIGAPSSVGGSSFGLTDEIREQARAVVDSWAKRAKARGVDATALVIEHEPPEDVAAALVKFAEGRRVDAIFVGSHGRTGIMRVLLGSTAEKVVKLSHCPVSVVR